MMKIRGVLKGMSLVCVFFVLAMVFVAAKTASTAEEVIKLRLGAHWPKMHLMSSIMESWIKDMETSTQGKLKVTYYPASQLMSDKDALDKMSTGVCDMGFLNPVHHPGQLPLISVNGLPFLFSNVKHGVKVTNEMKEWYAQEFEANKLKILWSFTPPPYEPLLGKKPIQRLDDWKGMRLGSAGGTQADVLKALGGVPLTVFTGDLYTSLERGTIDGMLFPLSAATSFKLQEVVKHVTKSALSTMGLTLSMNLNLWKGLPKDIQEKIMETCERAAERTGRIYDDEEEKAFALWEKQGVKIYNILDSERAKWKKTVEPVWNDWIKQAEAKGLPGKKIADEVRTRAEKYK